VTQPRAATAPDVHLVSFGGDGGVFQHTVAMAHALRDAGVASVLHMPDRHEVVDLNGLRTCCCVRWRTPTSRRRLRRLSIAWGLLTRTAPHIAAAAADGSVVHVQGLFRPALALGFLARIRRRTRWMVHTPHNTFSRSRARLGAPVLQAMCRLADRSIVFNTRDVEVVGRWGGRPVLSPLLQLAPSVDEEQRVAWRRSWGAEGDQVVVLFAGQIRRDKRLDRLVASAPGWPATWRLAVVGDDRGDWQRCSALARSFGVPVHAVLGYVPLDRFEAAVAAADVVVCPYDVGSQSGVIALARSLRTSTVATDVGGLAESADIAVPLDASPAELQQAIAQALVSVPVLDETLPEATVEAHLRAYGLGPA